MYEFKRLQEDMKIGWRPVKLPSGKLHASIICPKCLTELFLADKETKKLHNINPEGIVTPSVYHEQFAEAGYPICDCGWHDMIKLLDWQPE